MTTVSIPWLRLSGPNALFVKRVENGGMVLCKEGLVFIEWELFKTLPLGTPLLIGSSRNVVNCPSCNKYVVHEAFSHLAPEGFEWTDESSMS